jgi:hypothetical protein
MRPCRHTGRCVGVSVTAPRHGHRVSGAGLGKRPGDTVRCSSGPCAAVGRPPTAPLGKPGPPHRCPASSCSCGSVLVPRYSAAVAPMVAVISAHASSRRRRIRYAPATQFAPQYRRRGEASFGSSRRQRLYSRLRRFDVPTGMGATSSPTLALEARAREVFVHEHGPPPGALSDFLGGWGSRRRRPRPARQRPEDGGARPGSRRASAWLSPCGSSRYRFFPALWFGYESLTCWWPGGELVMMGA